MSPLEEVTQWPGKGARKKLLLPPNAEWQWQAVRWMFRMAAITAGHSHAATDHLHVNKMQEAPTGKSGGCQDFFGAKPKDGGV